MIEERKLPYGWEWAQLGVITQIQGGIQKQPSRIPKKHAFPFLRVANVLRGRLDLSDVHHIELFPGELERLRLAPGDLLVVEGNGSKSEIGRVAVWVGAIPSCVHQNHIIRARPVADIRSNFVASYLNSPDGISQLIEKASSTSGLHTLSVSKLTSIAVPVAPIAEQDRIVSAIEQHLSDIDAGVASLERVVANLKRYRAAVLQAACEGRLVPTEAELARKEGREYEPGDVLLRRILDERRARWEADQFAKLKAKGQVPRDDGWSGRPYEEPRGPDVSELPGLAEGWTWATVDQTIDIIDYRGRTPPFSPAGVVHLRSSNVRNGKIVWADLAYISEDTYQQYMTRGLPKPGDLLFTTEAPLGEVAVAPTDVKFSIAQRMMLLRGNCDVWSPAFLKLQIMSERVQSRLRFSATGSTVAGVSSRNFRPLALAIPPLAEQHRIVAEVERLISVADAIEQTARAQLARAQYLRKSILMSAFEGKLVPQDPNDEPASVLLERIRSAQNTVERKKPRRQSTRRRASDTEVEP
ncbi:restriction endonuclease subunit S [Sorangium sp. So ce260]|uniref:restriction endonuclease subunit S n=1 Tax=Sorangium sp. So ce260 TaxID=3133291 RepID=UPI003F614377